MGRSDASFWSCGSIVSCITPRRSVGVIASILSSAEAGRGGRRSGLDAFLPRVERGERARGLHALVDTVPLEPGTRLVGAQGQELDVRGAPARARVGRVETAILPVRPSE